MQKLIQNFVKCKKLKSISRKHGSVKFEPVSYVSASMREYTRREYYASLLWRTHCQRASGMFVQHKYERDNDTQAYLQRKNERNNATQAYLPAA